MKIQGPQGRADKWCARWIRRQIRRRHYMFSRASVGMAGFEAGYRAAMRDVQRSADIQGPGTLGELRAELIRYKKQLIELTGSARL